MVENKKWLYLLIIAILLVFLLTACKPAELVVVPTPTIDEAAAADSVDSENISTPSESLDMEGGITTDSGLQFLEMEAGDGPSPQDGDIAIMNFIATLPDGTEFGNSYQQGEPIRVILGRGQLLPGWEEGLKLMKEGGQARMILPAELAFGAEGYGMIPPDSPIILLVELISVDQPPTPMDVPNENLTTTESGLQYYEIIIGDGDVAKDGDTVTNHFVIWVKGDPEDLFIGSSYGDQPISFEIGRGDMVFSGWEEGTAGMQVGGRRLLIIPPELGLGEAGAGEIPPNATLIMEIELMDVSQAVKMTEVNEDDYTTTDSGLKYYDIVEGEGTMPEEGQTVIVHYSGWLEDGTKFDSSVDRGQPFSFQLGAEMVIMGWDEGVRTMKVGGKRQLVIPAELGYGDAGYGETIPPGATLIFDVELIEIQE